MGAIFVVVMVSSLAAFAVATTESTRDTTNLQLQSDRALAAARAGSEWAAYRALVQGVCPANFPQLNLTQGALRGFRVNMTCTADRPAAPFTTVDITVTAQFGVYGTPEYAYRRITARYPN